MCMQMPLVQAITEARNGHQIPGWEPPNDLSAGPLKDQ